MSGLIHDLRDVILADLADHAHGLDDMDLTDKVWQVEESVPEQKPSIAADLRELLRLARGAVSAAVRARGALAALEAGRALVLVYDEDLARGPVVKIGCHWDGAVVVVGSKAPNPDEEPSVYAAADLPAALLERTFNLAQGAARVAIAELAVQCAGQISNDVIVASVSQLIELAIRLAIRMEKAAGRSDVAAAMQALADDIDEDRVTDAETVSARIDAILAGRAS